MSNKNKLEASTLPSEEVNGKMYQPVESLNCSHCVFNEMDYECEIAPCESDYRDDGLEVIFKQMVDNCE